MLFVCISSLSPRGADTSSLARIWNFSDKIFKSIAKAFGASIVQMDGEDDHVHVLAEYPPNVIVSKLVNALKGASSKNRRKHRPQIAKWGCAPWSLYPGPKRPGFKRQWTKTLWRPPEGSPTYWAKW